MTIETGSSECFVLPLRHGRIRGARRGQIRPYRAVHSLAAPTDIAYVRRDSTIVLAADAEAEAALPASHCESRLAPRYDAVEDMPVEERGAGLALRHVRSLGVTGVWDHAEKLIACAVLKPPGYWSRYPPHKRDASAPCCVVNEEIYYRMPGRGHLTPTRGAFGYHRTYTGPEHTRRRTRRDRRDLRVRDHDVVLVPDAHRGPCMAAPGYAMYCPTVMAGPAAERSMALCNDRAHASIRGTWEGNK